VQAFDYCSDACEGLIEFFEKRAKQLRAERVAAKK